VPSTNIPDSFLVETGVVSATAGFLKFFRKERKGLAQGHYFGVTVNCRAD
jgi:hypothetical protein